jgi:hypothetical protein
MKIEIKGEGTFEVPDDATPDEIAALTAPKPVDPIPESRKREVDAMAWLERKLANVGGGSVAFLRRARSLFPDGLIPEAPGGTDKEFAADRAELARTTGDKVAAFAGEAVPALIAGQGVVGLAGKASSVVPQILGGATEGLLMSDEGNRAGGIAAGATGAAGGALATKALRGVGGAIGKAWHGERPKVSGSIELPGVEVTSATPRVSVDLPSRGSFVMSDAEKAIAGAVARGEVDQPVQFLLSNGVDLAPWQIAKPSSAMARVGKAMSSVAEGEEIAKVADKASAQTRALILRKGLPPGMTLPKGHVADVSADLKKMREGFNAAYDALDDIPVYPTLMREGGQSVPLRQALADVVDSVEFVDPAVASRVKGQLDRKLLQIGVDPETAKAAKRIPSRGLLKIRSDLRARIGKIAGSTDQASVDERDILAAAEDAITDALESQMPADVAGRLREVDRKYASFAAARDAQATAFKRNPGEDFTPSDILRAVSSRRSKTSLSEGELGDLGEEIGAFRRIWNDAPRTGERNATLGSLKQVAGSVTVEPMATRAAMSPTVGRFLLHETAPQKATRELAELRDWMAKRLPAAERVVGASGATLAVPRKRERSE